MLHLDVSASCFISGSFSMYVWLCFELRSSPELLLRRREHEDLLVSESGCCWLYASCSSEINLGSFQYSDSESDSESSTVLLWLLLKWKLFDLCTGM